MSIVAWFLGTKLGRTLAAAGAIALAIGLALLKAFTAGKAAEKAKQDRASLENLRKRAKTDEEIGSLNDADVDRRLGRWVPDDER